MAYQSPVPQSTEWETPQALFNAIDAHFHFDLDVCALPKNAKCASYFTPEDNGLCQPWHGICWMNPPYRRPIPVWLRKALAERTHCRAIVCLLPARTDTRWFHELVLGKASLYFIRGRPRYLRGGMEMQHAAFPSMLAVYYGNDRPIAAPFHDATIQRAAQWMYINDTQTEALPCPEIE